jgi:hypothetical protein
MNHLLIKPVGVATRFKSLALRIKAKWEVLKAVAPYAAIALLLPGGSVIAILGWFYRKKQVASHPAPAKAGLTEIARLGRCTSG